MKTLQEQITDYLFDELEPYRPTHALQWAMELTKEIQLIEREEEQRQIIIKKFCNRCVYFWQMDGCQFPKNITEDVIAECPYFEQAKLLNPDI